MLILTRKRDEIIKIGDDIEVMVVDVRGDKVRLGIMAPPDVVVHRLEIWELIQQQKLEPQERNDTDARDQPSEPNGNGGD